MFECTISVFNITNENNSFSIIILGHYETESAQKTIDEQNNLLEIRSQNGIELHVEQVRKKGLISMNDYSLSSLGMFKDEILGDLKNAKFNDLEDMVYRFKLTYDESMDFLDLKYIPTKRMGYSIEPNIYNVVDLNKTLKNILPNNVKIDNTIDERK